jgi:hypothetical protein
MSIKLYENHIKVGLSTHKQLRLSELAKCFCVSIFLVLCYVMVGNCTVQFQFTGHGQDIHSDHSETDTYTPTTVATAVALSAYRAELL